jgi:hypothetical protein
MGPRRVATGSATECADTHHSAVVEGTCPPRLPVDLDRSHRVSVAGALRARLAPRASCLGEELILKPIGHFDDVVSVRPLRMSRRRTEPRTTRFSGFRKPNGLAGGVIADEEVDYSRLLEVPEHDLEDAAQPTG